MAETFPILEFQKFKTMSDKMWFGIFIEKKSAELNAANKLTKSSSSINR